MRYYGAHDAEDELYGRELRNFETLMFIQNSKITDALRALLGQLHTAQQTAQRGQPWEDLA